MYVKLITLTALVASVAGHDVAVGVRTGGRKVYDQHITASPALWIQTRTVSVNATEQEVICRIAITDHRPDKNGDVKITEGGVGQKNVTIDLKSPTVLRGLDFSVDVYTMPEDQYLRYENTTLNATIDSDTNINKNASESTEATVEKIAGNVNSTYDVDELQDEANNVPAIVGTVPAQVEIHTIEQGRGNSSSDTLVTPVSGGTDLDKGSDVRDGVEAATGGLRGGQAKH